MKSKFLSTRWILLAAGIVAIIGLTGMNVYSLLELKNSTLEYNRESKELQVLEFADRVRYWLFLDPFDGMNRIDMVQVQEEFNESNRFPEDINSILAEVSEEDIYDGIYFMPGNGSPCTESARLLRYHADSNSFEDMADRPEAICNGLGYARNRMNSRIEDYPLSRNYIFDTHRSLSLALINLDEESVIGYLHFPIDRTTLVQRALPRTIKRFFGEGDEGMNVWLRDWTQNEIIATNTREEYRRDKIEIWQRFPEVFDDWGLEVQVTNDSAAAAANASLIKNLVVLGIAVLFLLGALVFMFITAQRERELAQRQAGFLANVTHELKTPLAVMQAAGENLSDGRVDDQSRLKSYGNHIYNEAIRLRRMIDKLLDVAKADAGQSLIEAKPVYLNDVLSRYLRENEDYIKNKDFKLETDIEEEVPPSMVDTGSFETIMGNLIENSLKYCKEEKEIAISLHHRDKNIIIKVRDKGVGIPKSAQKHVFDKFFRVEDAMTAETKGHGLGLSIVKNLVELNGGIVKVESEEGTGSVFTVEFPVMDESEVEKEYRQDGTGEYTPSQIIEDKPDYVN